MAIGAVEIIVLILVIGILIKLVLDARKGAITLGRLIFWGLIWIALAIIVIFPEIVIALANAIGIERPKDLPIYVSIIILFVLILKIGIKIEKVEQEITNLVKNLALKKSR